MTRDYYDILGVARTADTETIKKAYRRLAKKYHPDVNADPSARSRFQEVQQAYDVLSDDAKRKLYDQYGQMGIDAGAAAEQASGPFGGRRTTNSGPGGFSFRTEGGSVDFDELFGQFFGGQARRGGRAGAGRSPRQPQTGADLRHKVTIPFDVAARGGTTSLRISGPAGTQTIDVRIPKALNDGARLRVRGKGEASVDGGPAGDIILTVHVAPHPYFKREGLDLIVEVPINIDEAIFGAQVEVPTLDGRATLRIPPQTGGGKRLRLRGMGIENAKGDKGDLFAVLRIAVPEQLTDEQRAAFEKLRGTFDNPRRTMPW